MKVAHLPEPAEERVVFRDGLGVREWRDAGTGDRVEWLHLVPAFAGVEGPLRERVARLAKLQHVKFARILSLEPAHKGQGPILVSSHVAGSRLADVLEMAGHGLLTFDAGAGLQVTRDVLGALAVLHDSRNVTHGALGPERVVVTPTGRVVMVEHVLAQALDRLQLPRHQLWRDWRIATPPAAGTVRFDIKTDIAQVGLFALAAMLGRPLDAEEYPHRLRGLLPIVQDRLAKSPAAAIAGDVVAWLERLVPVDSRRTFATVRQAQQAYEALVSGGAAAMGISLARVKGVMAAVGAIGVSAPTDAGPAAAPVIVPATAVTIASPLRESADDAPVPLVSPPPADDVVLTSADDSAIDIEALLALEAELEGGGRNLETIAREREGLEKQFADLVESVAPSETDAAVRLIPETPAATEPLIDDRVRWSSMPVETDVVAPVVADEQPAPNAEAFSEPVGDDVCAPSVAAAAETHEALVEVGITEHDEDVVVGIFAADQLASPSVEIHAADVEPSDAALDRSPAEWWRDALPWRHAVADVDDDQLAVAADDAVPALQPDAPFSADPVAADVAPFVVEPGETPVAEALVAEGVPEVVEALAVVATTEDLAADAPMPHEPQVVAEFECAAATSSHLTFEDLELRVAALACGAFSEGIAVVQDTPAVEPEGDAFSQAWHEAATNVIDAVAPDTVPAAVDDDAAASVAAVRDADPFDATVLVELAAEPGGAELEAVDVEPAASPTGGAISRSLDLEPTQSLDRALEQEREREPELAREQEPAPEGEPELGVAPPREIDPTTEELPDGHESPAVMADDEPVVPLPAGESGAETAGDAEFLAVASDESIQMADEPVEAQGSPVCFSVETPETPREEPDAVEAIIAAELVIVDEGADGNALDRMSSEQHSATGDEQVRPALVAPPEPAAAPGRRKRRRSRRRKSGLATVAGEDLLSTSAVAAPEALVASAIPAAAIEPVAEGLRDLPDAGTNANDASAPSEPSDAAAASGPGRARSLLDREVPAWTPPADLRAVHQRTLPAVLTGIDPAEGRGSSEDRAAATSMAAADQASTAPVVAPPARPALHVTPPPAEPVLQLEPEIRAVGMPDLEEFTPRLPRPSVTSMADAIGPVSAAPVRHGSGEHWSVTPTAPVRRNAMSWRRIIAASILVALFQGAAFAAWWWVQPGTYGTLVVQTAQPGVDVLIDGKVVGRTPFREEIVPGRHVLTLRQGRKVREMPVEISLGVVTTQALDWPAPDRTATGNLQVTSTPTGADVFVNGVSRGKAPVLLEGLTAGKQQLTLRSEAGTVDVSATVIAGETASLDVPIFAGWILVDSRVEVSLVLGRKKIGSSMDGQILMPPGTHRVEAVNDALGIRQPFTVRVEPGAVERVVIRVPTSTLQLQDEPGSEVFVDGERVGTVPGPLAIPVGTHDVLVRRPDGTERRQTVTVRQGETVEM